MTNPQRQENIKIASNILQNHNQEVNNWYKAPGSICPLIVKALDQKDHSQEALRRELATANKRIERLEKALKTVQYFFTCLKPTLDKIGLISFGVAEKAVNEALRESEGEK